MVLLPSSSDVTTPPTSPIPSIIDLSMASVSFLISSTLTDQYSSIDCLGLVGLAPGITIEYKGLDLSSVLLGGPLPWPHIPTESSLPSLFGQVCWKPGETAKREGDTDVANLRVTETCGQGAIWNAFRLTSVSTSRTRLVLKLSIPGLFPSTSGPTDEYNRSDALHAIKRDLDIVSHLSHLGLGGTVVPLVHGIYAGRCEGMEVWGMLMEDGGEEVEVTRLSASSKWVIIGERITGKQADHPPRLLPYLSFRCSPQM